ncbi:MAG TPA: ribonuclease H family protein [Candidatus Paceibacterota bacterium]
MKKYYAYLIPGTATHGITNNWEDCEKIVKYRNAKYKGFNTAQEARNWLTIGAPYIVSAKSPRTKPKLEPGIYFDAGTGRGKGVEVSVTDENGVNLLHKAIPKTKLNEFGKQLLKKEFTNNYGELLGCKYALQIATKQKVKHIFGDSKLVLRFWSKGILKRKALPPATVKLADTVTKLRKKFETSGGTLAHISGDHNPADLGFH